MVLVMVAFVMVMVVVAAAAAALGDEDGGMGVMGNGVTCSLCSAFFIFTSLTAILNNIPKEVERIALHLM